MAYAVWKYDLYPFRLTGKIEKVNDDGTVEVDGYGKMRFRPRKVISDEKGKELEKLISDLREEKRKIVDKIHEEGALKIVKLIGI